jgi:hypothetical protein
MSFDAEQFVLYQIGNAPMLRYPFPHFFIQPIFPDDYFQSLRGHLPPTDWMSPMADTGVVKVVNGVKKKVVSQAYPGRYSADLADIEERAEAAGKPAFWGDLAQWLMSDRLRGLLLDKFQPAIAERFGAEATLGTEIDARLVRDFTNYAIGPHTDAPRKLISLLFYLPADGALSHLGTTIFAHQDPSYRCEGERHHGFDGFKKVASMPYVPNSLFAFFKTDYSFHGLDQIHDSEVQRDLILYNVYVRSVGRKKRASWLAPWRRKHASATALKND